MREQIKLVNQLSLSFFHFSCSCWARMTDVRDKNVIISYWTVNGYHRMSLNFDKWKKKQITNVISGRFIRCSPTRLPKCLASEWWTAAGQALFGFRFLLLLEPTATGNLLIFVAVPARSNQSSKTISSIKQNCSIISLVQFAPHRKPFILYVRARMRCVHHCQIIWVSDLRASWSTKCECRFNAVVKYERRSTCWASTNPDIEHTHATLIAGCSTDETEI